MNTTRSVERDERTVAVENAGHKWGFLFLTFGLLIDGTYRSIVRHEAPMDLLALVIVGGAICTIYQARQKALPHVYTRKALLIVVVGAVFSAILAVIITLVRIGWPGRGP